MKHTPGPWRISDARSTKVVLIDDAKGQAVGELVWADVRNPADARLIAAAPDLLEALEKTESALARCIGPHKSEEGDRHPALAQARAAIAKAGGAA